MQLADARQAPQLVVDIARRVVAEGGGVAALSAFLVAERIDQQETGAGLLDLQALGQHRLRHARLGFLQAVLHVHLGQVRIGARLEGDDDLGGAVGVVGRLEVEQALGAVQRLLEHTGDGVHQHLRRGAGIGGGDGDLWRRDIGVLRYRQFGNDQQAGQGDEQGHHPGEVRPLDEEFGHRKILGANPPLLLRRR